MSEEENIKTRISDLTQIRKNLLHSPDIKELFRVTKKARKILGEENVFGPDDLEKYFGIPLSIFDAQELKKLPFTANDLRKAKKLGSMLVLRIPIIELRGGFFYATIKNFKERFPQFFSNQNWYKEEYFFRKEVPPFGWSITALEPLPESFSRTHREQKKILQAHVRENQLPHWKTRRRRAVEIVYDSILYQLKNKKRPLESHYEWATPPEVDDRYLVRLGRFNKKGFYFKKYQKNTVFEGKATGLCPALCPPPR